MGPARKKLLAVAGLLHNCIRKNTGAKTFTEFGKKGRHELFPNEKIPKLIRDFYVQDFYVQDFYVQDFYVRDCFLLEKFVAPKKVFIVRIVFLGEVFKLFLAKLISIL